MESKENLPHALITIYTNLYKERYGGKSPSINRYREKWGMQDVIDSVGYDRAKELINYYFTLDKSGHPISWFLYNFDKLDQLKRDVDADKEHRDMLRYSTKIMVEERRNDEHRGTTNISSMPE